MTSPYNDADYSELADSDDEQRRKQSAISAFSRRSSATNDRSSNNNNNDKRVRFHLPRVTGIAFLCFLCCLVALIVNDLSRYKKRGTQEVTTDDSYTEGVCKVHAFCGFSQGRAKWTLKSGEWSSCPDRTYNYKYSKLCDKDKKDYKDDCVARDAGNTFIAFTILSMIVMLPLCIILGKYTCCTSNKNKSSKDGKGGYIEDMQTIRRLRWLLFVLFLVASIFQFIAPVVWLSVAPCDSADPNYDNVFDFDSAETPGVSSILLLIAFVADMVGAFALVCCWDEPEEEDERFIPDSEL